jgi:hypothetical protein
MSEALFISLGNSLVMSVAEHVDHNTGIITYAVKGKRLSGSVVVYPYYDNKDETTPSRIFLTSDSRKYETENRQDDILTINGIKIDCWKTFDLEGREDRSRIYRIDRLGSYGLSTLPDATHAYARKILEALANLWSKRNDVAELIHAAARANASKRLQEEQTTARALTEQLHTLRAALAASEERAACYCKLQQEHQAQSSAA